MIDCKCGCGIKIEATDSRGRSRSYVKGHHNLKPRELRECACQCGNAFVCIVSSPRKYIHNHQNALIGFQKGYTPHNKGISYTPKNLEQFIEGGKKTRFKKGQLSGDKHHNWAGGVTPLRTKIRNSEELREWRKAVFERDDYTCVLCAKRGGDMVADHIKGFALHPELRFVISNGRTLCKDCNYLTTYKLKEWKVRY